MKKIFWFVLSFLFFYFFNYGFLGQQNLKLKNFIIKKDFDISSDNKNYYFKFPYQIKFKQSTGYFILDNEQLIFLDKTRTYIRNFIKKGQGPGEFTNVESFLLKNNEIAIHQVMPNKVVIFDLNGQVRKEFKPKIKTSKMLTSYNDHFFMLVYNYKYSQAKSEQYTTYKHEMVKMSEDGEIYKMGITFPVRWFTKRIGNVLIADTESEFIYTVFNSRYLVFSSSNKYKIDIFDLKKEKIVSRIINKNYSRQKFIPLKKDKSKVKRMEMPRKFYSDVQRLFVWKQKIFVFTSTYVLNKGIKVDVYDITAQYISSFYYKTPDYVQFNNFRDMLMTINENFLFCEMENDEDEIVISRYSIILKINTL